MVVSVGLRDGDDDEEVDLWWGMVEVMMWCRLEDRVEVDDGSGRRWPEYAGRRRINEREERNAGINVPWVLAQYLSKKAMGLREASDINGGHYVSRIARNLGYFTPNKTKKCSAPAEGTLLDKKTLKVILDNSKMRIKENDVEEAGSKPKDKESKKGYKAKEKSVRAGEVEKANEWRDVMLLKTGYQLDYALPILIHLGNTSGYTFASDYNPPMVPPYPCSTTPFIEVGTSSMAGTSMGNQEKKVVSRFSGEKRRASYRLEDESTDSDNSEQSDNDDDSNTGNDMDEE
ncbi:hypothetical protein Tco_0784021 [Tanacetum coccineum]